MIFEGKVDESEVDKIRVGTNLQVSLVQFQIKRSTQACVLLRQKEVKNRAQYSLKSKQTFLPADFTVRAGYSANASLVLQEKDSVPAIREALLQFDNKTQEPYVEVQTAEQTFERRDLTLGISDGINVEIVKGLEESDLIKVWNKLRNQTN